MSTEADDQKGVDIGVALFATLFCSTFVAVFLTFLLRGIRGLGTFVWLNDDLLMAAIMAIFALTFTLVAIWVDRIDKKLRAKAKPDE